MVSMFIIAGLGNPGDEYKNTRHNVGRIVLSAVAKANDFSEWKADMKLKALTATGKVGTKKTQFIMPDNFMNNSGKSIAPLIKTPKDLANFIVIYDDMDLPMGRMKISFDRGDGGHNGLASIIKCVKSREFIRIRIGVSPTTPGGKTKKPSGEAAVLKFLLGEFKKTEFDILKKLSKKVAEAIETIITDNKEKAMSLYNQ